MKRAGAARSSIDSTAAIGARRRHPCLLDDLWLIMLPLTGALPAGSGDISMPATAEQRTFGGGSLVMEYGIVEIDRGEFVLLGPVILGVLPFRLVAALWQEMHAAHQIAGVEVLRIDPGQDWHVLVLGPPRPGTPRARG